MIKNLSRKTIDSLSGVYEKLYRTDDNNTKECISQRFFLNLLRRLNSYYFRRYISMQSFSPSARITLHYLGLSAEDNMPSLTLKMCTNGHDIQIHYGNNEDDIDTHECYPNFVSLDMIYEVLQWISVSHNNNLIKVSLVDDNAKTGVWHIHTKFEPLELTIESVSIDEGFDFLNSHRSTHPDIDLLAAIT